MDDFQLERAETPSNLNLLENGSLQHWGHGWTMGALANYQKGTGLFSTDQYAYSIRVGGDAYTELRVPGRAHQQGRKDLRHVRLGQGHAVPDNKQTATGDDAAAKDKYKQFGLRAIITYSDNTTEYHYVPLTRILQTGSMCPPPLYPRKKLPWSKRSG